MQQRPHDHLPTGTRLNYLETESYASNALLSALYDLLKEINSTDDPDRRKALFLEALQLLEEHFDTWKRIDTSTQPVVDLL